MSMEARDAMPFVQGGFQLPTPNPLSRLKIQEAAGDGIDALCGSEGRARNISIVVQGPPYRVRAGKNTATLDFGNSIVTVIGR
jgi:hypothetical protein